MKQLLTLLLLSSLLLAENVAFWQVQKVRSTDVLNIREKANYKTTKIGAIPYKAICVVNHGCGKNIDFEAMGNMQEDEIKAFLAQAKEKWCYVDFDGASGWVHKYYLKESQEQCK